MKLVPKAYSPSIISVQCENNGRYKHKVFLNIYVFEYILKKLTTMLMLFKYKEKGPHIII